MEQVTLHDGQQVPRIIYKTTILGVQHVMDADYLLFYELVHKCHHPNYELSGDVKIELKRRKLWDNSRHDVYSMVRAIVINAVIGDDFSMQLRNPIKGTGTISDDNPQAKNIAENDWCTFILPGFILFQISMFLLLILCLFLAGLVEVYCYFMET